MRSSIIKRLTAQASGQSQRWHPLATAAAVVFGLGFATYKTGEIYAQGRDKPVITPILPLKEQIHVLKNTSTDGSDSKVVNGASDLEFSASKNAPAASEPSNKVFTRDQVSKHNHLGDVWVTFQGVVYDVSDFIESHPGGAKIMLAAGKGLEPFWSMYRVHDTPETRGLLEQYRIGVLTPEERANEPDMSNPYATDPDRHNKHLTVRTQQPFNAEAPLDSLAHNDVTSLDDFFVRNHLPVPKIDPSLYELRVSGDGVQDRNFSLEELRAFPKQTIRVTVQCAGNGRSAMDAVKPVRGLPWGYGAISTAQWSGVRLLDVMNECGYQGAKAGKHIVFEGLDRDMTQSYAASIPIEKAMDPRGDVILAYEMNGSDIPADNGFPVRAIVPGTVGARNVKWVGGIHISNEESDSHWQQKDYKGFSPSSDWDHLDYDSAKSIQELPVQSAICHPLKDDIVLAGSTVALAGYAFSGGGREIIRVDVSADGGETWSTAKLSTTEQGEGQHWAFRRWEKEIQIPDTSAGSEITFICKAVDRSYNVQPERFEPIYNVRGVLCNAWHRVKVKCE